MAAAVSDPDNGFADTMPRHGVFNAPSPEQLSTAIPSVKVVELLGHGGMGAVYRARQLNLDRPVALKILAPRLGNDPGFAERFAREARTLARLNHPNIVTIFDFGRTDEFCYLIMELIEGVNLREAIQSGGVSAEQALEIIPRICEALQYAHDQGIVHRDIKPENILVGQNGQVKIADFGLAKMLDHAEANFTLTATQQVLGTRNYMAPEQIEKPGSVDHRADIYSLGVVFYELLTGELPLGRFSLPSEKSAVGSQMDAIVLRTLEKEPARRFQQASEVKLAVESINLNRESPLEPFNGKPSVAPKKPPVIAEGKKTGTPQPPVMRRRISLPFKNDQIHGGMSQLHGIAHLLEENLEIEFRVHKFGVSKSGKKTVVIPYSQIVNTLLNCGMFSSSMEIQSGSLETFDEVPGSVQGRLKMTLEKSHDQLAEEFRIALDSRIASASPEGRAVNAAAAASSLAHVPFTINDVHAGFSEAAGIAKITQEHVVIEFEIQDALGVVKSAPRIALVPISNILVIKFRQGLIHDSIEVQTNGIDAVSSIPNSSQGKFRILTKKRERDLARNWLCHVHRATGIPLPEELADIKPEVQQRRIADLRDKLRPFRLALVLMVLVNLFFFGIAFAVLVFGDDGLSEDILVFLRETLSFPSHRVELLLVFSAGPLLMAAVGVVLWWLLATLRSRFLVFGLLALIALPVHPGVVIGFPLAVWLWVLLLKPSNMKTWTAQHS